MSPTRSQQQIGSLSREGMRLHIESILESVPDAMVVIDEDGRIIAFSRAAEALFGYSRDEIVDKPVSVLMTRADEHRHDDYMRHYMQTGRAKIIGKGRVVQARRADGTEFPVDLKIGDAVIGDRHIFTGFMRDLSEQQKTELRMRQMQAELSNFSRLSAVGTMASAMAHELNQPLTAVANYLEASRDLLERPDSDTLAMVQEALDEAAKQAVRAGQIVRKLRDYVTTGEVVTRPVDLSGVIRDAVALAGIGTAGTVHLNLAPGLPPVKADPIQIQQVIVNLVRNALEALGDQPDGRVEVETGLANNGLVSVAVRDNGPGMTPGAIQQAFRPFQSTKRTGMGLGLSICQTIIEAHGGQISADSRIGEGTCFTFSLPVADGESTNE